MAQGAFRQPMCNSQLVIDDNPGPSALRKQCTRVVVIEFLNAALNLGVSPYSLFCGLTVIWF